MSAFRPKLGPPGSYIFPLGYAALPLVTLHPVELRCTLRATLHPKSYATPSELSCTLLSYASPFTLSYAAFK